MHMYYVCVGVCACVCVCAQVCVCVCVHVVPVFVSFCKQLVFDIVQRCS